jgi:hypothetical protein
MIILMILEPKHKNFKDQYKNIFHRVLGGKTTTKSLYPPCFKYTPDGRKKIDFPQETKANDQLRIRLLWQIKFLNSLRL